MRASRFAATMIAMAILVAGAAPAFADGPAAGAVALSGTAHLNVFQCPGGGPACTGTFSGQAQGSIAGVSNSAPWSVAFVTPGNGVTASFAYGDTCFGVGNANGSGTISAGLRDVTGTYSEPLGDVPLEDVVPAPVTGILIPFQFTWLRVGLTAVVSATISINIRVVRPAPDQNTPPYEEWINVVSNKPVVAVATFIPEPVAPEVCLGQATTDLDATVAAALEIN